MKLNFTKKLSMNGTKALIVHREQRGVKTMSWIWSRGHLNAKEPNLTNPKPIVTSQYA